MPVCGLSTSFVPCRSTGPLSPSGRHIQQIFLWSSTTGHVQILPQLFSLFSPRLFCGPVLKWLFGSSLFQLESNDCHVQLSAAVFSFAGVSLSLVSWCEWRMRFSLLHETEASRHDFCSRTETELPLHAERITLDPILAAQYSAFVIKRWEQPTKDCI